jgi:hypothetical protein
MTIEGNGEAKLSPQGNQEIETEKVWGQEQDIPFKGTPLMTYFLQPGPTFHSVHHLHVAHEIVTLSMD